MATNAEQLRLFALAMFGGLFLVATVRADVLYVADSGDNQIKRFTGAGVGSIFASNINGTTGLAFAV